MKWIVLSRSAIWFLVSACCALALNAAEIELQREVYSHRSLVRLADVATVRCDDAVLAGRLNAVELFPAPPIDGWMELDNRDLFELLELRGFDPFEFRLTGAAKVKIIGRQTIVTNPEPAPLDVSLTEAAPQRLAPAREAANVASFPAAPVADPQAMSAAQARLAQAIVDYLRRVGGGNYAWKVTSQIDPAAAATFASGGLEISGGDQPWTGRQTFGVRVHRAEGIYEQTVVAEVSLPSHVVATKRNLAAGEVIQVTDLQYIVPTAAAAARQTLNQTEAAVGMEVVRNVPAGQPLEIDMIRKPILVQRNAVATLNVRAGGVVVGTKVRAMDEGAAGDAIRVQSLFDRQQFTATVVGPQQVEMIAGN